jgi:hypothetical protein
LTRPKPTTTSRKPRTVPAWIASPSTSTPVTVATGRTA